MTKSRTLELRKKPGQSRSADTVATILEAAARILETEGFAGYTTNAIAERAGVSIGSLYQYFPGKDAVTVALLERETNMLLADASEAEGATDVQAGLRGVIRAAVGHQMRRPTLARLLDIEEARLPIGPRNAGVAAQGQTVLSGLLARRGHPDAEILAGDVLAIIRGMVDAAGQRGETDADRLEQRVIRAVFGYLDGG
jgi:AcrR family transcriptional regulator